MNYNVQAVIDHLKTGLKLPNSEKALIINALTAQKRELEIEAALERVRSVAMGMTKADDLLEICRIQFTELVQLGFSDIRNTIINVFNHDKEYFQDYDFSDDIGGSITRIFYNAHPVVEYHVKQIKSSNTAFVEVTIEGEQLNDWKEFRRKTGQKEDPRLETTNALYYYLYSTGLAAIGISNFRPLTEEQLFILKRFRNTFDLAYRRFVDITNAAAQAREARIEAALEKIRSRTMAMQRSSDLLEVANVLREQMGTLGQPELESCIVHIYKEDAQTIEAWYAYSTPNNPSAGIITDVAVVPYNSSEWSREVIAKYQSDNTEYTIVASGEKLVEWYKVLEKVASVTIEYDDNGQIIVPEILYYHFSKFSGGALLMISNKEPSQEARELQKRAALVFDLAYTRFLDLKKAEAQAREAQIEAALERIRNRTLLMKDSNELSDAAVILFQQFNELGMLPAGAQTYFSVIDKETWMANVWITQPDGKKGLPPFKMPLNSFPPLIKVYEGWKQKEPIIIRDLSGEDLSEYFRILKNIHIVRENEAYQQMFASTPQRRIIYDAIFLQGTLGIATETPVSKETLDTLMRFAKVFEFIYTRFLDLQQAEAQAREAQIEAALERVRARAMAMHKSQEVIDVAVVMHKQLQKLGFEGGGTIIIMNEETGDAEHWTGFSQDKYPKSCYVPYFKHPCNEIQLDAWKKREKFLVYELAGEEKRLYDKYFFTITGYKDFPAREKDWMQRLESVIFSFAFMKYGAIHWGPKALTEEESHILQRFAQVFEQSYTRFLDLQKAEAQAREAQIEAALERVRSRTMAMHKSDELSETAALLFKQLNELGNEPERISIALPDEAAGVVTFWVTDQDGSQVNISFKGRLDEPTTLKKMYAGWKAGEKSIVIDLQGEELAEWLRFCREEMQIEVKEMSSNRRVHKVSYFSHGWLTSHSWLDATTDEKSLSVSLDLLERFAVVFNLTYRRFLDLQQAEAQAREAQIEAALERIRAKTMAMHKSDQLAETAKVFFEQFNLLGEIPDRMSIGIINEESNKVELWVTDQNGNQVNNEYFFSLDEPTSIAKIYKAWKDRKDTIIVDLTDKNLEDWLQFVKEKAKLPIDESKIKGRRVQQAAFFSKGFLLFTTHEQVDEETMQLLVRFARVFDLTYTRFLDLQNAEAQAREAKIEASLEKVRSRALVMQKPSELVEVAQLLRNEMGKLGVEELEGSSIFIHNDTTGKTEAWYAIKDDKRDNKFVADYILMDLNDTWVGRQMLGFYYSNEKQTSVPMRGAHRREWINYCAARSKLLHSFYEGAIPDRTYHLHKFSSGFIGAASPGDISQESWDLLQRATSVFSLAYTRFSDLQQAEAQAKEAQIEASLERVRSRTMAMHSSDDVSIATATMFTELEKLGIKNYRGGILNIRQDQNMEVWSVNTLANGSVIRAVGLWDMTLHPWWQQLYKGWINKDEFLYYFLAGKDKDDYIRLLNARPDYLPTGIQELPDCHIQAYYFGEGAVWNFSLEPHSEEQKQIMKRFASVFSLTFRRYQDLQKAEAQAREAQIEAALERVRARAMAMQNSEDVGSATSVVFSELHKLGIETVRCGILLIDESKTMEVWTATPGKEGEVMKILGTLDMTLHPLLSSLYDAWKRTDEFYCYRLADQDMVNYYRTISTAIAAYINLSPAEMPPEQFCSVFFTSEASLYTFTLQPHNNADKQILKRFTSVFSLTFRRYQDLKNAEAQAWDAIKASSLDRIRAEIASMRTADDLRRITPAVWKELTVLGVPFFRCGVFIVDEKEQKVHVYLSTPDGKPLAVLHLDFNTSDFIYNATTYWRLQEVYRTHWDREQFIEWVQSLIGQGQIQTPDTYQGGDAPPESLTLQLVPFAQGMLYIGSVEALTESQVELVQTLAESFSVAYARYEDFKKLEEAKSTVETTLEELRATQNQLIQKEKMASLGELTAGVAHEIQNPLNFVNNFSEVNKELAEELKSEIDKVVLPENVKSYLKTIAEDIEQNQQKINYHGKRADAIVKSMLQHSRISSGEKQPSDINALADEYLRLSYHGMRAKDKSFNATLETHFEEGLNQVHIIPQDIGRVLLNLFNNAFYAMNEKKKQLNGIYEPQISVSTRAVNGNIEIHIRDNGTGIPQQVLDKIYQPFFTTKPTGEGTGLGLSLSYDIITKGHGGELKINTVEGEYAEFVVQLPG